MTKNKLYRRLRGALVAAGLGQEDLADVLRMSPTSISNRFTTRQDWRVSEMYAVLDYLGIEQPASVLGFYFPKDGVEETVDNHKESR